MNYGMKAKLLASNMGCTVERAEELIKKYFARYPTVEAFYASTIAYTRKYQRSASVLGRCRRFPQINDPNNAGKRWAAERQAVNMVIQGSAADVVRLAMINIHAIGLDKRYGCKMLLQVHDELLFECPEENVQAAFEEIKEQMMHPFLTDLAVPLTVSGHIVDNWAEAK